MLPVRQMCAVSESESAALTLTVLSHIIIINHQIPYHIHHYFSNYQSCKQDQQGTRESGALCLHLASLTAIDLKKKEGGK
jgi:hypothetical protein